MAYPRDLTVAQKVYITEKFPEILLTKSKPDIFHIRDAVFYVVKTGCQWKMLPQDFPGWPTCCNFFRKWTDTGVFSCMMQSLVGIVRESCGKVTLSRPIATHLCPLVSVTMELHCALTARTNLHDAQPPQH